MSVNIELGDKYVITSDDRQFILNDRKSQRIDPKTGSVLYNRVFGYYGSLDILIRQLLLLEIRRSDITELREIKTKLDNLIDWIEDCLYSSPEVAEAFHPFRKKDGYHK